MKIKINPLYSIMVLLIGVCIYVATLTSYGYLGLQNYFTNEFVFAFAIVLLCMILYQVRTLCVSGCLLYYCLILIALVSELINGRSHTLNLFVMLVCMPLLIVLPHKCFRLLIYACLVAQCLFFVQLGNTNYFNSYAMTAALFALEILSFMALEGSWKLWKLLGLYFLSIALLLVLGSRAALLAYAAAGFLLIISSLHHLKKNRLFALIVIAVVFAVALWTYFDELHNFLFSKWAIEGIESTDITSGRLEMWEQVLENHITLWGHKETFVMDTFYHEDTHNIFIQMIVKYGMSAVVVFLLWCVDLIRRIRNISGKAKIYFIVVFSFYLFTGMFENVLFLDCKVFLITFIFIVNLAWLYKVSGSTNTSETPDIFERSNK